MNIRCTCLVLTSALVSLGYSTAADWPRRGMDPTHNAISLEKNPPLEWEQGTLRPRPGQLAIPPRNILWAAALGSQSWGDPVIADGLVWVGTNNEGRRDPEFTGDAAVLMCFREKDGQFLYQYTSPRHPAGKIHDWEYSSLASSPLVEGNLLWFCTNRAEVVCLDISKLKAGTGQPEVSWKLDMMEELGVRPCTSMIGNNALQCSVASYRDRIYVNTTHGRDRYKRHHAAKHATAPSLICLTKQTGELLWEDHSPGANLLDVQQGSPLAAEIGGRPQVVMGQGDGWLRSFDALTGEKLWEFDINDKADRVGSEEAQWSQSNEARGVAYFMASPVLHEGRIYIASGRNTDACGGLGRLVCVDPTKRGDISSEVADESGTRPNANSGLVWEYLGQDKQMMHKTLSSVVIHQGLLIAPDFLGLIHGLDVRTGKARWVFDMKARPYGSPLIVNNKIYVGNEEGEMLVLPLTADQEKVRALPCIEHTGPIYASPVFANGVLYVMTQQYLFAIKNGTP